MSSDSRRYTVTVPEDLAEHIEEREVASEFIREAVANHVDVAGGGNQIVGLNEQLTAAWRWLDEKEEVDIEYAKTALAQETQISAELVDREIIKPLKARGLVELKTGMWDVKVVAQNPWYCSDCDARFSKKRFYAHRANVHGDELDVQEMRKPAEKIDVTRISNPQEVAADE